MKRGKLFWAVLIVALILLAVLYYFVFMNNYYRTEDLDVVLDEGGNSEADSDAVSDVSGDAGVFSDESDGGSGSGSSGNGNSADVISPPPVIPAEDFG